MALTKDDLKTLLSNLKNSIIDEVKILLDAQRKRINSEIGVSMSKGFQTLDNRIDKLNKNVALRLDQQERALRTQEIDIKLIKKSITVS